MAMKKEDYDRMMGKLGVGPKPVTPPPITIPPLHLMHPPVQGLNGNGNAPVVEDDNSQDFDGYTRKFVKEDWQDTDIYHLINYHDTFGGKSLPFSPPDPKEIAPNVGTANWSEMGCLSGDTLISINRAGKGQTVSIDYLYRLLSAQIEQAKQLNPNIPTYVQSYVNGRIRLHKLITILNQGTKPVLQVNLANGKSVVCTFDHKIMLSDGSWKEAQDLVLEDRVVCKGDWGYKSNSVDNSINESLGGGRFIDKDGYVRVLSHNHPRANASNHVYEHILVMENHLERLITTDEHVHHINEIRSDNRINNLELKSSFEHKSYHAKQHLGTWSVDFVPVTSVIVSENLPPETVYDLVMEEPYHNFVANGIVVHNCYKTSTGLWLADKMIRRAKAGLGTVKIDHKPAILIITSKGGKGTFLEAVPEILPNFTLINIETSGMFMYKNGHMLKLPSSHKFVPKEFDFPVVCLAHYDIFSRSTFGQFVEDGEGMPMKDENGKLMFKPWSQSDYITQRRWDYVWCDEFHRLKDRKARWTVQIKKIKARVSKHGSSGTGFINKPDEVWQLLNFLHPEKYGSYWHFREKYCEFEVEGDSRSKTVGVNPKYKDEFREIIRSIGVRRELDEVMPHIKKPIFMPMDIELNPTQRRMYNQIKLELKALDEKGVELYAANVLSLLQRLRQITVATPEVVEDYYDPIEDRRVQKIKLVEPSSKIDSVMEVLEGLRWDEEKKEPLVVFSCFKDPLELLKARLDKHNEAVLEMGIGTDNLYKYIHLDVGDSDVERYRKWHDEFPKFEHRIFMSTLQLGGESINLTPARHVVFLDRSWSPKDNSQGIGRIRRPGQEGQPVVIHINANNTTDQYIEDVNNIKHGWFTQIFGKESMDI